MPLPTIILPGYFASATEYRDLERDLLQQGIPAMTVPLTKWDWVTSTLRGRSVLSIISLLDRAVKQMLEEHNASEVNLIGHSAGGWIARIYLGEKPYGIRGDLIASEIIWNARSYVNTLVTLGTPHTSQERWTKQNLEFVNNNYPGAFYHDVRYVCVAGKAVYGRRQFGSWLAYNSYQLTCGEGNCWGDGIIPLEVAHLEGAINITLEGIMHAPTSPGAWYGSLDAIEAWISYIKG